MTEMAYGSVGAVDGEAVLSKWWRTLDKSVLTAILILFSIGLLLGLASSPPLAEKNGLSPFHYVNRQTIFGSIALIVLIAFSMMSSKVIRRLGVIGFVFCFVALILLPFFGTDFGKGAVRWYGLGFASVQPSEFIKPGFIVTVAWLISANSQINGPPGRLWSFFLTMSVVALLIIQPDFGQACLILFGWGVVYFVAGASFILLAALALMVLLAGSIAYSFSEHFAKRIDGFLSPDIDPRTQLGYATNAIQEGGFFGVGVGEGQVKWSLPDAHTDFIISVAAEEYGLILDKAKKEVNKIHFDSKTALDRDIQSKKELIEKEIEKETLKAQKEISELKKNSISSIQNISENITSNIIGKITGDKLNESSIKSAVEEISKKNLSKYL